MPFNYKKIIKDGQTRECLLHALDWVPDRLMVQMQYRVKTGRKLNLSNPQRFTEKLCWYKLFYRDPLMAQCVDKALVRDYVAKCNLDHTLNKVFGIYDSPDEIDFDTLPEQFVLKDTLGGGNNEVIVCPNKEAIDISYVKRRMAGWVKSGRHRKHPGREWFYDTPDSSRILVEELLMPPDQSLGIVDYKFFFFNGHARYLYVMADRRVGSGGQLGIFEVDGFRKTVNERADESPLVLEIPEPGDFDEMYEVARRLAAPFPHARVDLYYLGEGDIRFGELTFCDGSGYFPYSPDSFDFLMGDEFCLPEKRSGNTWR